MRIPPSWTWQDYAVLDRKGKEKKYSALGWSFESLEGARQDAVARAKRVAQARAGGRELDTHCKQQLTICTFANVHLV